MNFTRKFPFEYQLDAMDCGPACLKIISKFFGKYYSLQYLRDLCGITREGVSFLDLSYGAEKLAYIPKPLSKWGYKQTTSHLLT